MKLKYSFFFLLQFIVVISCASEGDSTSRAKKIAGLSDKFNIVYYQDFSESELGVYSHSEIITENNAQAYINGAGEHKTGDYNVSIVSVGGDKALKGTQDKGEYGLSGAVNDSDNGGGFRFLTQLPQGNMELYMSYNIMFRPGMDFVLHGKLPAMSGGKWNDYDGTPLTGFTAQPAFIGDKDGDIEGGIYWYSRWATDQTSGGNGYWKNPDGTPFQFDVSDSTWYNITIRVSLNTLGQANGIMEGYVNGKLANQWKDLELRSVESYIDILNNYWFYGGNTPIFATNYDEWVLLDDVCAFTYTSSVEVPRGQTPSPPGRILELPFLKSATKSETDQEPPSVPGGLTVLGKDQNSISIGWNAASDNVGVEGYRIFSNDSFFDSTSDTKFTLNGLSSGTNYKISVCAFDKSNNESAHSESINVSTVNEVIVPPNGDMIPPSKPIGLRASLATENSIQLSWNSSTDNVGVEGYRIFLNDSFFESTSDIKFTLKGLSSGTNYKIAVCAFDKSNNESAHSESIYVSTANEVIVPPKGDMIPPSKPIGLRAAIATENSIQLSWNSSNDNVAVTGYHIHINSLEKGPASSNTFNITGLIPGFEYHITVSAFDAAGNVSLKSNELVAFTKNSNGSMTPDLPLVEILEVQETANPSTRSILNSFGFVEVEDYGIVYSETQNLREEGIPIYAGQNSSTTLNKNRVQDQLQVLYNFSDESDNTVTDVSGIEQSIDLYINQPLNTKRLPGQGLEVVRSTIISSESNAEKLTNLLFEAGGITLEAWIKPGAVHPSGHATVMAMTGGDNNLAFSVEQISTDDFCNYTVKMNTNDIQNNGINELLTAANISSELPHHVVYTWDWGGEEVIYVDGKRIQTGIRLGDLSPGRSDYQLTLANDLFGNSSWNGTYYLIAIYSKSLSEGEVINNYRAGFGQIEYKTDLTCLQTNTQYYIAPFVRTDQGVFFGEAESFMVRNLLDFTEIEGMNMEVVPNPSNGQFILSFEDEANIEANGMLRIVDVSGRVLYSDMFNMAENLNSFQREYNLSTTLRSGIYTVMLIMGKKSLAKRLVLY